MDTVISKAVRRELLLLGHIKIYGLKRKSSVVKELIVTDIPVLVLVQLTTRRT